MAHQSKAATANVTWMGPNAGVDIKDPPDTLPSENQPPGVDEDEPQSLEEALTSL